MFRVLTVLTLLATTALADPIISYADQAGPDDQTIGGTPVRMNELIDVATKTVVFDAIVSALPDLNAAHIKANGNVLFSVRTSIFGFNGVASAFAGDIIEWDGTSASLFFDVSTIAGTSPSNFSIDALYVFESGPDAGKILLSAQGAANTLGGLNFGWGDLVLYDPTSNTATLFFDQDTISGTLTQKNIDAVHVLDNGDIIFSVATDDGSILGVTLKDENLYVYSKTGVFTIAEYLDGDGLFDNVTRDLDAVTLFAAATGTGGSGIPEPGLLALVCFAAAAVLYRRRR